MKLVRTLLVMAALFAFTVIALHADDKPGAQSMSGAPKKMKMAKPMMVDAAVAKLVEEKERKINEAWKNKDGATFMSLVDADGMQADPSGFSPVSAAPGMMNDYAIGAYTLDDMKVVPIDKDAVILTYTWKGEATYKGQAMPPVPMYVSTIWAKRGNDWKAVYHQETMPPPPGASAESH